jgi:hypothetical protein
MALRSAVILLGVPTCRPPRRSPGFDGLILITDYPATILAGYPVAALVLRFDIGFPFNEACRGPSRARRGRFRSAPRRSVRPDR